jgi:uncharacterized membrane protein
VNALGFGFPAGAAGEEDQMASRVENSVEIDRPVGAVFSFVDDYKNTSRYIVGMIQYRPTTKVTSGKGARFDLVKKTTGLPDIKSVIEITAWKHDREIVFDSVSGFENGGSYTFTARGDRTIVKLANTYDLTSLLGGGGGIFGGFKKAAGGAMSKVAEGQARKDLTTSLEKLKHLVETATPASQPKAPAKPAVKPAANAAAPAKNAAVPARKAAPRAKTKRT